MKEMEQKTKIKNVLLFKEKFREFIELFADGNVKDALEQLDAANDLLLRKFANSHSTQFHTNSSICELITSAIKNEADGIPDDDESLCLLQEISLTEKLPTGLIRLVSPPLNVSSQFMKCLHLNSRYFYYQLSTMSQVERHFYLRQLVDYVKCKVGTERCAICENVLSLHNQIQGILPPTVVFIMASESRIVLFHQNCFHRFLQNSKIVTLFVLRNDVESLTVKN